MTVEVRDVAASDREDWFRLWQEWQEHMHGAVPAAVSEQAWVQCLDPGSGLHALIARSAEGAALGFAHASVAPFAWTGTPILFLQDLFVTPQARGQGAGEALLTSIYALADRLGAAQVFWMVDEENARLQAFYEHHAIRTPYLRYMRHPWPW